MAVESTPASGANHARHLRDGAWHTAHSFDNAHDTTDHHEHRYIWPQKQDPIENIAHRPCGHGALACAVMWLPSAKLRSAAKGNPPRGQTGGTLTPRGL